MTDFKNIIVDSCGWIEYFSDGKNADNFAKVLQTPEKLIVPVITLFEVYKKIKLEKNEELAREIFLQMQYGHVVLMEEFLSMQAAEIALNHKLGMADSFILATANMFNAKIWTQDADFENLPNVNYFPKQ